jgi:hypothetical protein
VEGRPRTSRPVDDDERQAIEADLLAFGIAPNEVMTGWTGADTSSDDAEDILVLPIELQSIVLAFLIGATQWRWLGAGFGAMPLGLDYAGLRSGLAMARLRLSPEEFDGVRVMEVEALQLLAKASS